MVKAKKTNEKLGREHEAALQALAQRRTADSELENQILSSEWPKNEGAFLDLPSKVLRVKALGNVLRHGRPLAVLDEMRALIEGDGSYGSLTDSSRMANLIPLFGKALDTALSKKRFYSVSLIFDGLSEKGNWVSVLFRGVLVGESMTVVQGLLDMPHTALTALRFPDSKYHYHPGGSEAGLMR